MMEVNVNTFGAKGQNGFTLTELMVVVALIAILCAAAIPSYNNYVMKGNRADASASLMEMAQQMERCFSLYGAYNHSSCPYKDGSTYGSTHGFYKIIAAADESEYSLKAQPADGSVQVGDLECMSMSIDYSGLQESYDSKGNISTHCW